MDAVRRVRALVTLGDAVVGQDAAEGRVHRVAVDGRAERLAHQVDLARGLPEGAVLEHVDPRRERALPAASVVPVKSTKNSEVRSPTSSHEPL